MKKFLAIFLVFTLLFSFAACNKNGNDNEGSTNPTEQTGDNGTTNKNEPSSQPNKNEEKTTAEPFVNPNLTEPTNLFNIVDVKNYDVEERKPNSSATSGATYLSKKYGLISEKDNTISDKIKIDQNEIVLGVTALEELLNNGWELSGNSDVNTAVKVGEKSTVIIKNAEDKVIQINVKNNTNIMVAISDCTIVKLSILKDINQYSWKDFVINDTINIANGTYRDYVSSLGEPFIVNVTEHYNGNEYSYCKVSMMFQQTINGNTYTITVGGEDKADTFVMSSCVVEVK